MITFSAIATKQYVFICFKCKVYEHQHCMSTCLKIIKVGHDILKRYVADIMKRRPNTTLLEWTSILLILASVLALVLQLVSYQNIRSDLQLGMTIADVPVGGMSLGEAEDTLTRIYSTPVELHFLDEVFYLEPAEISFRLEAESMLAIADTYRTDTSFWSSYWDYLWRRTSDPAVVPIVAEYSRSQLRNFLVDLAARYDLQPIPPKLNAQSLVIVPGSPGYRLDIESSMTIIDMALRVPTNRRVLLTVQDSFIETPTINALENLIDSYIKQLDFNGIVSVEVVDLLSGEQLSINKGVAYAGLSIMKIPIILETYRVLDTDPLEETAKLIEGSIVESSNLHANILLSQLGSGDKIVGASVLTSNMQLLGLENTFMAGYFDQEGGVPPVVQTTANRRTDVDTDPDAFMQTTPDDMASLLTMLYQCGRDGGGAITVVFVDKITQRECQSIINLLSRNKIATLIEAGVPEGVSVAHKHGFGDGDTIGDAGIVFSPGGDYVVVVYIWQSEYLEWENSAPMVANISRMIFNYFNS